MAIHDRITNRALEKGKQTAKEAYEENLSHALRNGAGQAHKMTAVDSSLSPLRLVIEEETSAGKTYITAPKEDAAKHTEPWAQVWRANSPSYDEKVVGHFKNLRKVSLELAAEFANNLQINAPKNCAAL